MRKKPDQSFDQFEIHLIEIGNYLYSHIFLVGIAAFAAASVVGLWTFFFKIPFYQTKSYITVKMASSDPLDYEGGSSHYWATQNEIENKIYVLTVFLKSNKFRKAFLDEIEGRTNLLASYQNAEIEKKIVLGYLQKSGDLDRNIRMAKLNSLLGINGEADRRKIEVSSISSNPVLARAISNLGAELLVKLNFENLLKEMNSVVSFIEKQTRLTDTRLQQLEAQLASVQSREQVLSIPDVTSSTDRDHMERRRSIHGLEVEVASNDLWISQIQDLIQEFKVNLSSGGDSHLYLDQMRRRLDLLRYKKALGSGQRQVAGESSSEIDVSIKQALGEFTKSFEDLQGKGFSTDPWKYLANLESSLLTAKQKQLEAKSKLKAQVRKVEEADESFDRLPLVLKEINQLKRDIAITEDLYSRLKAKLQETKIKMAGKSNDLSMLLYSRTPTSQMGLSIWKKFLISFIGGALSLIGILSLRYILIPTVRSREDLRRAGTSLIAEIPFARFNKIKGPEFDLQHPLLLSVRPNSDEANAIRQARFNLEEKLQLQEARFAGEAKVLTVCSANSAEGKSFVSANLSHSLSLAQFRVLLLDLDLLKPCLREYFGVERPKVDYGDLTPEGDIQFEKIQVNEFLDLVDGPETKGTVTDLLETPMLGDYLSIMKARYDVIIIDTPPIRNSMESLIASRYSDGLIYVANQRQSLRHDVLRAIDTISETYHKPIFSVLNFSYDELNASRRRVAVGNRV